MTPSELVDRALALLLAKDMAGFAGLWAESGVLEFPFAPPGYPTRLDGRAAIEEYMRGYPDIVDMREITEKSLHRSVDPEVVIVEFAAAGRIVATDAPYQMRYIAVITVRDNAIQLYRDYWSPHAAAETLGGTDHLVTAFAGGTDE
ncbi:nuclear transport factor 2 family protein [Nocardia sp. NPDC005998]|uniref:nuclear transport factor 2 family protein n=1 Tax=Nocardia sp. NPDC005998 TaxID=3156894 RepID=UPI0033B4B96A